MEPQRTRYKSDPLPAAAPAASPAPVSLPPPNAATPLPPRDELKIIFRGVDVVLHRGGEDGVQETCVKPEAVNVPSAFFGDVEKK
jgi:hypothetical protein